MTKHNDTTNKFIKAGYEQGSKFRQFLSKKLKITVTNNWQPDAFLFDEKNNLLRVIEVENHNKLEDNSNQSKLLDYFRLKETLSSKEIELELFQCSVNGAATASEFVISLKRDTSKEILDADKLQLFSKNSNESKFVHRSKEPEIGLHRYSVYKQEIATIDWLGGSAIVKKGSAIRLETKSTIRSPEEEIREILIKKCKKTNGDVLFLIEDCNLSHSLNSVVSAIKGTHVNWREHKI